jgi:feruloyl esterase
MLTYAKFAAAVFAACLVFESAHAQLSTPTADDALTERACLAINELELPELILIESSWLPRGALGADLVGLSTDEAVEPPAHCRVRGTVDPTIGFEIWLPAGVDWNGRFLAAGNDGDGGQLNYAAMLAYLSRGYATASTDTGHTGPSLAWLADGGRLRDFGYRAIYEMTAKAGAIVAAFYGRPADYRYFNGCALGGRQALMEAARFPMDYDGIVAGAPLNPLVANLTTQLWLRQSIADLGNRSLLGPAALELVHDAAIEQCDAIDGVRDGVLEDPRRCNFDPGRLQCGFNASASCLTTQQLIVLRQIYAGPSSLDGSIDLPGLAIGAEESWQFTVDPEPPALGVELMRRAVIADPAWDWRQFDLALDHPLAVERVGWMLDVPAKNLSEFRDYGGKLLIYQGWNDAIVPPEATIETFEAIESSMTQASNAPSLATSDFVRLFMVPGMRHCGGGAGTDEFDAQRAIEDWVERGIPATRLEASRVVDEEVIRTRPLCPYPQVARYRGNGNSDRSGSFVCDF